MGEKQSLRSKASHFVSDLTTLLLNPISDNKNNNNNNKPSPPSSEEEVGESKESELEGAHDLVDGPDTSSFTAFLYSFLSSSDSGGNCDVTAAAAGGGILLDSVMKEDFRVKRSLFSRTLGLAIHQAVRMGGFRSKDRRDESEAEFDDGCGVEMRHFQPVKVPIPVVPVDDHPPEVSEPSKLISDSVRNAVYDSLPAIIHGRKWLMLYSTWKHGISLATLYRRSMVWPGLSLLVKFLCP